MTGRILEDVTPQKAVSNVAAQNAQKALSLAREIILQEEKDDQGLSNQHKWNFVLSELDEIRAQGFFASVDFDRAYEWEINSRLLAYGFIARLRAVVFLQLMRESKSKDDERRFDYHYHLHYYHYLRIKDKYEAGGKKVEHHWLN
jgi:hypothetical protein